MDSENDNIEEVISFIRDNYTPLTEIIISIKNKEENRLHLLTNIRDDALLAAHLVHSIMEFRKDEQYQYVMVKLPDIKGVIKSFLNYTSYFLRKSSSNTDDVIKLN